MVASCALSMLKSLPKPPNLANSAAFFTKFGGRGVVPERSSKSSKWSKFASEEGGLRGSGGWSRLRSEGELVVAAAAGVGRVVGGAIGVRTMGSVSGSVFAKPRAVVKKVASQAQPEGDGATVRRSIGRPELKQLDPFLLLDYFSSSGPAGFPDHPHRGFETVTYMLEGAFTHQDFAGHKGTIHAGDVQWMTAGRGIVHCEMPATNGLQRGLQLWINLGSKDKMIEPNYQELQDKDIPKVKKDGVKVVVIAGESMGSKSPVYTHTPTMYLDFTLQPGAAVHQPVPEGWNAFTFILEGSVVFGKWDSRPIDASHTVVFGDGEGLSAWNKGTGPAKFVLVAGKPLNEPVAQYGPFVMNTQAEIMDAVRDYRSGQNGFENARTWRSDPVAMF